MATQNLISMLPQVTTEKDMDASLINVMYGPRVLVDNEYYTIWRNTDVWLSRCKHVSGKSKERKKCDYTDEDTDKEKLQERNVRHQEQCHYSEA